MSIHFNRNRVQTKYEQLIGISSPEELRLRVSDFKNYVLTNRDITEIMPLINQDALDFFNNAVISFSEGIDSIFNKRFSWATVKLYYSVYYLLRASLCCYNYALLRNRRMYRLKIAVGESPYSTCNKKYNTTHEGTISHYKDVCSGSDVLLTNHIGDMDAYEWMEYVRNVVNYLDVSFREPACLDFWDIYKTAVNDNTLSSLLNMLENDTNNIYCFQEDYAVVAIPIKRMKLTIDDLNRRGLLSLIDSSRIAYVDTILRRENRDLEIMNDI